MTTALAASLAQGDRCKIAYIFAYTATQLEDRYLFLDRAYPVRPVIFQRFFTLTLCVLLLECWLHIAY